MAEPKNHKKISLRQILDMIAEDESFNTEERESAREAVKKMEDNTGRCTNEDCGNK